MDLTGKAALVTGGARVGATVALALASAGADVALTYRGSIASASRTAEEIRRRGRRALILKADLSRPKDADRAAAAVLRAWGGVDALVHMASVYEKAPLKALEAGRMPSGSSAVDLHAGARLTLALAPGMRRRGGGRVVLFSDWTAAGGRPRYKDYLPYYVAKAGVKALAESLALELAPSILVNAVAPGPVLPPEGLGAKEKAAVEKATPLGRWGGADEIAKAVLFFIESDFVTGETLRVDGGRHLL